MRVVCTLAFALALVACRGKATREMCGKMMDHYLDLVVSAEPDAAKMTPKQLAAVREMKRELKLGEKSYKKVHDRCEAEVTKSEYACALDAKTPVEWEGCIAP
jgi:hypothetical protein